MTDDIAAAYNELPYRGQAFVETHPSRLATMGMLFGMRPANVENCRVLEIGCGEGSNVIPMAVDNAGSEFVGFDLSHEQVAVGLRVIERLGLKNIQLKQLDILDADESLGRFDFIIAHGVYSWVPPDVRRALLELCGRLLTAHGIAYVNHSTYPGAHVRSMVREMMLYHVRKETGTARRIRNARALLEFLLQAATTSGLKPASPADDQDGFYAKALQWEAENIRSAPDAHFRHDSLAEVNDPGYFADFVHAAEQCGLQYLADSYYYMMQTNSFSPEVCRQIDQFTHNVVEREQYIDFIRNRVFRHTLLCRDNVRLNHHLTADRVPQFHVASRLEPASRNLSFADETAVPFCHPDGPQVNVGNPFLKAAFLLLAEHWPQFIPFEELASRAAQRLASKTGGSLQLTDVSRETQLLAEGLLGCIQRGLVQFSVCPPRFELQPTERPKVSPLARLQAEGGEWVTNRRHEGVKLNPLRKLLLPKLDGRHSRDQLLQMLVDLARAGTLQIDENGGAITDNDRVRAILSEKLDATLGELARLALLIQ